MSIYADTCCKLNTDDVLHGSYCVRVVLCTQQAEFTRLNKAIHGAALTQSARLMPGTHLYIPGRNAEIEARLEKKLKPSRREKERQDEEKRAEKRRVSKVSRDKSKKKSKDSNTAELEQMVLEMAQSRDSGYLQHMDGGGGGAANSGGSGNLIVKMRPGTGFHQNVEIRSQSEREG